MTKSMQLIQSENSHKLATYLAYSNNSFMQEGFDPVAHIENLELIRNENTCELEKCKPWLESKVSPNATIVLESSENGNYICYSEVIT